MKTARTFLGSCPNFRKPREEIRHSLIQELSKNYAQTKDEVPG
jgi:hypothetical protein